VKQMVIMGLYFHIESGKKNEGVRDGEVSNYQGK